MSATTLPDEKTVVAITPQDALPATNIIPSTPQVPDAEPLTRINSKNLASIPSSNNRILHHRPHSPDDISLLSADDFSELRLNRLASRSLQEENQDVQYLDYTAGTEVGSRGWRGRLSKSWQRNKGLVLVMISQFFGVLMNVTTRMLEMGNGHDENGMHPFQVLFARMSITVVLATIYMYYTKVPDFPFGARTVRPLLIARGIGGFFGVFGLYWSLQYLPLADATVLTFLAPTLANYVCSKLLHETFTRLEQLGGIISLAGVVLIARPTSLFASAHSKGASDSEAGGEGPRGPPTATPSQRLAAVGMAMVGVLGASVAYTTIRWIGTRAHPLISVNYFATWCTLVSLLALTLPLPPALAIPFVLPSTLRQWTLLFFIGVSGFAMQFLLTAGLTSGGRGGGAKATNMVFVQMVFAVACDWGVWGVVPGGWEWVGVVAIVGSAVGVAVQKERAAGRGGGGGGKRVEGEGEDEGREAEDSVERGRRADADEQMVGLMRGVGIGGHGDVDFEMEDRGLDDLEGGRERETLTSSRGEIMDLT